LNRLCSDRHKLSAHTNTRRLSHIYDCGPSQREQTAARGLQPTNSRKSALYQRLVHPVLVALE
jgi:hypothetical protein